MNLLALDTSTEACSVALCVAGRRYERYCETPRGHAELLLPMVNELLAAAGVTLKELTAIAFARGPGSFTGVRLGASVVQGLAYGAGIGVVPISTLQAVALHALASAEAIAMRPTHVLVCNDARMDEVYTASFTIEPVPAQLSSLLGAPLVAAGLPRLAGVEQVLPPSAVMPLSAGPVAAGLDAAGSGTAGSAGRWLGVGRGFRAYPGLARLGLGEGGPLECVLDDVLPHATEVLALAAIELAAGRVLPSTAALPVYVRDKVAKVPQPRVL